jgi:hypothetical protein
MSHIDDRSAAALGHRRGDGGDEEERRLDIYGVHLVEVGLGSGGGRPRGVDAGLLTSTPIRPSRIWAA